jgi:RNA-directed DNA polymerase
LKAGIMTDNKVDEADQINTSGTPQGGVISPLLANIALHGMETILLNNFRRKIKIIRYADDFVVMSNTLETIGKAKIIIEKFLSTVGLELSTEKTRIGHSMEPTKDSSGKTIKPGLDFLGFHFRNIQTSIHRGVKTTRGKKQEFRQISTPARESVKKHKLAIKALLRKHKSAPRLAVIKALAAVIRG